MKFFDYPVGKHAEVMPAIFSLAHICADRLKYM
jgi:hypothetical protein